MGDSLCRARTLVVRWVVHPDRTDPGEVPWRFYGADQASTKYSPAVDINRQSVHKLAIAWRWPSVDQELLDKDPKLWTWTYEATPLMVDGVIYTSTSLSQAVALDAVSGERLWKYDPQTYKHGTPPGGGFVHRGVAYWRSGSDKRVLLTTGDARLIALGAQDGQPIKEFGSGGEIDLTQGLRRHVDRKVYGATSPPTICRNTVIVGSSIFDVDASARIPLPAVMPPGDVRGYDPQSGKLKWIFHSIPEAAEFGSDTWHNGSAAKTGAANAWSLMSCDEELGYVYVPFGSASNDHYGGERPGHNLFGESLVAVDAVTGKRVWHFQAVRHGLWDYDLPAAPNLVDITVGGQRVKALAQVSKQAFVYVLDRTSGQPVWPMEDRAVPQSDVPGERTAPTQPFPTKPPPFDRQGVSEADLIDFTPELRREALQILRTRKHGALFTPPSRTGTITLPGTLGGASWAGAALHPITGVLYVPSITNPVIITASASTKGTSGVGRAEFGLSGPRGLPLVKPPYGRITAIDLNTGEQLWVQPVGDGPRTHPDLRHLNLPRLGWPSRSFVLLTNPLLFVAQEGAVKGLRGFSPAQNAIELETEPSIRACWRSIHGPAS